tara:strand:+ start:799 stop:1017 length:219 start_codon:yes stop_codon:yes gene_type:complete
MIVFGVDIPLVEIIFTMSIIIFILLVESIVVVMVLLKQMNKSKKTQELLQTLSDTLLKIKEVEIKTLDKLRK